MKILRKLFIPPVLILISLLFMALLCFLMPEYNYIPFPYNFGGILVSVSGFLIMGKARELFRKHKTTLTIEKSSAIITEGPFSISRNPMYLGMFILLLGAGISFMNLFALIIPFLFIFWVYIVFIRKEEKMLVETFGEAYLEYKKNVRRWI